MMNEVELDSTPDAWPMMLCLKRNDLQTIRPNVTAGETLSPPLSHPTIPHSVQTERDSPPPSVEWE